MDEQEVRFNIFVNCKSRVYYSNMLLYSSVVDEATFEDIRVVYEDPVVIFYDNTSAINISKNLVIHSRTKHISIRYHFLREKVTENEVKMEYVSTKDQIVDIFTKPLPMDTFEYLREKLGVITRPALN